MQSIGRSSLPTVRAHASVFVLMTTKSIIVLAFMMIFQRFPGCSESATEPLFPPLLNTSWKLESIMIDNQPVLLYEYEQYTILFTDDTVMGMMHCNEYTAGYYLDVSGNIVFGSIADTRLGCKQPSHETEFRLALGNSDSVEGTDSFLILHYKKRTRMLNFKRAS